jgi:uncharacterized membrane protein
MSRTRVNMNVRRSGAVVAGVLLLLTGWRLSRRQAHRLTHRGQSLSGMIARCAGLVLNSFAATT